ncbi:MAG TPA: WecB/TagA/CpsF family glycosyltransferase [Limnochordia bacterium]|nr:WecB/TagA/CpsF family glycosyltransferase [Limnochordia bacterium]
MSNSLRVAILGVGIDLVRGEEVLAALGDEADPPSRCRRIVTANTELVMMAQSNAALAAAIGTADWVLAESVGIMWAGALGGTPFPEQLPGIEFAERLAAAAARAGWPVYLLGGRPGVAPRAAARLAERVPGLVIAGARHGYFAAAEETEVVAAIARSDAGIVFVGLGMPRQELFMARQAKRLNARAAIAVGGSFDVWAGDVKRAPAAFRKLGLEWFYRLIKQPRRARRMAALPAFVVAVLWRRLAGTRGFAGGNPE